MSRKKLPLPILPDNVSLIDSHCHLDMDDYLHDLNEVINRAAEHGVRGIVTIGIDLASSRSAVMIARRYSAVRATIGFHPHDADKATPQSLAELAKLASDCDKEVVAWGEIGLDYVKKYAPPDAQRKIFRKQLQIAREMNLPVIIHDREAHEDTLQCIREQGPFPTGGVMHCFSGDMTFASQVLDVGLYISIPGIVTFKNASALQKVAQEIPLDRMLLETDSPFLTPAPFRGKRNRPEYLLYTAEMVAKLRGISIDEIAQKTSKNTRQLFSLPKQGNEQ